MNYLYEKLGYERFQEFCQALLIAQYPDLRCFPVGQPDGGRDGLSSDGGESDEMTVIQVKFRRADEKPSADWMIKALEGELPKIKRLIDNGAKRYIMMTNASATAHPQTGSHDKVQAWLDDHISVPAGVLWRDELDRRLDGASSNLKLSYPSVLTGEDALTLIVAAQMGPARERITRTLRAFVSEQFRKDEEVKFRQVDLTNSLLSLFVDVPVMVGDVLYGDQSRDLPLQASAAIRALADASAREHPASDFEEVPLFDTTTANTADALLDPHLQAAMPWIILQGAPGQGKSTIAQYVCQVHRARFLDRSDFLASVSDRHATGPFRLPFKVDLRDLALYLDGQTYLNTENNDAPGVRSLERFLASLVSIQSGGREFTSDDFAETASSTPILIFLDGLDEVPNKKLRRSLVENVLHGLNRLRDDAVDVQVVVTTRPSLFGKRLGFGSHFKRLELAPISLGTVYAYCEKWMLARRLDEERSAEVREILHQKLDQPHIRELTRNPMQLAILLNLILSVGHSLPDARTSLYREYVNLFMNRESEKSAVVRRHRAIISEIVEYLAWTLQSLAESARSSGSIGEEDLRNVVTSYLKRNKLDTSIAKEVFENGIERVWVLVQRVEGLFEFEVQPLREYFTAKHLYATAPALHFRHDAGGGDRAERFEALVRNPYWSNVARFYAGFYQPGEIADLALSLKELGKSDEAAVRYLVRNIAVELLADWIFNLKVAVQEEIIALAFDSTGLNLATLDHSSHQSTALSKECGRDRVAGILTNEIVAQDASATRLVLTSILERNGGHTQSTAFSDWISAVEGAERTRRFSVAMRCGAVVSADQAMSFIAGDDPSPGQLRARTRTVCNVNPALMDSSAELTRLTVENMLDGGGFSTFANHPVAVLARALIAEPFGRRADSSPGAEPRAALGHLPREAKPFIDWFESDFARGIHRGITAPMMVEVIERGRAAFGDRWAFYRLAAANAGVYPLPVGRVDVTKVRDAAVPLFERAALARAYRGSAKWWRESIAASGDEEARFLMAILLSWAPSSHIKENLTFIDEYVGGIDESSRVKLFGAIQSASHVREYKNSKARNFVDAADLRSDWAAYLLVMAFGSGQVAHVSDRARSFAKVKRVGDDQQVVERWQNFRGWKGLSASETDEWLALLKRLRAVRVHIGPVITRRESMPVEVAEKILDEARQYPIGSALAAYVSVMNAYSPLPVGDAAESGKWELS